MKNIPSKLPDRFTDEKLDLVVAQAREVPEEYILQIIVKSRQPHVMKFESHEDAEGRFKDLAAYRKWSEKDRIVYLLIKQSDNSKTADVGGIIWFGKRENDFIDKIYNLTFGIRLYEGYVGKGLAVPFMSATHADLKRFYPNYSMWLDFAEDNIAAQKAYESFGYSLLAKGDGRIIMGYHSDNGQK